MNVNEIDGIENVLSSAVFLIPIRHLADGDRYVETREARLS